MLAVVSCALEPPLELASGDHVHDQESTTSNTATGTWVPGFDSSPSKPAGFACGSLGRARQLALLLVQLGELQEVRHLFSVQGVQRLQDELAAVHAVHYYLGVKEDELKLVFLVV